VSTSNSHTAEPDASTLVDALVNENSERYGSQAWRVSSAMRFGPSGHGLSGGFRQAPKMPALIALEPVEDALRVHTRGGTNAGAVADRTDRVRSDTGGGFFACGMRTPSDRAIVRGGNQSARERGLLRRSNRQRKEHASVYPRVRFPAMPRQREKGRWLWRRAVSSRYRPGCGLSWRRRGPFDANSNV
jgi:hypothetical protein